MAGESEVAALGTISEKTLSILLELLKFLREQHEKSRRNKSASESKSEAEPLKGGTVAQADLMKEAHRKNYSVAAQDGIAKADMKLITAKAKQYGIPVAFIGKDEKDNIRASFRDGDKAIFTQIMTDIVKEKLRERPNELATFQLDKANIQSFQLLMQKHDLTANFIEDKNGGCFCVHEERLQCLFLRR